MMSSASYYWIHGAGQAHDYIRVLNDELYQHHKEITDYESMVAVESEIDRLSLLHGIAGTIVGTHEDIGSREMIQEYRNRFGPLPG